ncbi:hypothetical protein Q5P01_000227 [Channa striata]|uniref:Uncharacterized protein n=1 Tax=Channa striata TaxID=64152 RepID=A0AA88LMR3_CHASR|nr:hypothetical protein Q5P01_000227 [Channa striata]
MRLFEHAAPGEAHATVKELTAYRCFGKPWTTITDSGFPPMSAPNPDPRRVENHTPIFMQLLPLMAMGEDRTWSEAELTERMTRIYPSACGRGLRVA